MGTLGRKAVWGAALALSILIPSAAFAGESSVLGFTFGEVGVQRLEARPVVANGRGNGALQKLGATREAVLRKSFLRDGIYHDQVIWSICRDEWREWQGKASIRTN